MRRPIKCLRLYYHCYQGAVAQIVRRNLRLAAPALVLDSMDREPLLNQISRKRLKREEEDGLPQSNPTNTLHSMEEEAQTRRRRTPTEQTQQDEQKSSPGMQRYLVTVEYIGTRYSGFQKQKAPNFKTVQGVLEEAFFKFIGKRVESAASSRTDGGVHGLRNVCHVDVERISKRRPGEILPPHEPEVVKRAVNHFLQKDGEYVQVVEVQCVPSDFHARFEAKERIYHYRIVVCKDTLPLFERDRAWHVQEDLNIEAMQQACKQLAGHHDFSSFRASGCQAKSPVKTLDYIWVCEMPSWPFFPSSSESCDFQGDADELQSNVQTKQDEKEGTRQGKLPKAKSHLYVVTARARSFLYHQVRLMVGLLKAVGAGELTVTDVRRIMEARTVTQMPEMAPACGLYLADVKYDLNSSSSTGNSDE